MSKFAIAFVLLLTGAAAQAGGAGGATPTGPNPVVEWNRVLLTIVRTPGAQPGTVHPTRSFAILHAAMYDAVNSIERQYQPYAISVTHRDHSASPEAAAAAAAHEVLVTLYPTAQATLDSKLDESLAQVPDGTGESGGVAIGRAVARALLTLRSNDSSGTAPVPYVFRNAPGEYQSTPPNFPPQPAFTHWAAVTPFVIDRASQFRPGPPPALASIAYRNELNEVKSIGASGSATATAEQAAIGRFWGGPIQNYWNEIAQTATLAHDLSTVQSARLFALLNLVIADSAIAFYDAKYTYRFWRPVTAIRGAANDGNDQTQPDANWLPLAGNSPADPSYPGAHAVVSAASAAVLSSVLRKDNFAFEVTSEVQPGVRRSFRRFSDADQEATLSRIYAGVHFRSDETAGQRLGKRIADFALDELSGPTRKNRYHDE